MSKDRFLHSAISPPAVAAPEDGGAVSPEKSPEQVRLELRLSVLPTSLAAARDSLASHRADPALCAEATHDLSHFARSLRATISAADFFDPVHSLIETAEQNAFDDALDAEISMSPVVPR